MARPQLKLDADLIAKLASIHCTMEEIAAVCGCSIDTLERRFAVAIKEARAKGRSSLRRIQWEAAQKGNATMMIWLGKQLLEQRDHRDMQLSGPAAGAIDVNNGGDKKLVQDLFEMVMGHKDEIAGK